MDLELIKQKEPTLRETLKEVEAHLARVEPEYLGLKNKRDHIVSQLSAIKPQSSFKAEFEKPKEKPAKPEPPKREAKPAETPKPKKKSVKKPKREDKQK